MKKYFIKITVVSLMTTVFFMASGFCFHSLLDFKFEPRVAQAASTDNLEANNYNGCAGEIENNQINYFQTNFLNLSNQIKDIQIPVVTTGNANSILPCCAGESHPSVVSIPQSSGINKFIPVAFISENQTLKIIPQGRIYAAPIFSPPELLSLRTTILRI